jgi:hypothetical protein
MWRTGAWLVWVWLALLVTPVWLDGSRYEGYRPDGADLWLTGTSVAVVAGLALGWVHRRRRLARLLILMAATTVVYAGASLLVYRRLIPLEPGLPGGLPLLLMVTLPVVAAGLGFGAGSLVRRPPGELSERQGYAVSALTIVVGAYAMTGFVQIGAEWATTRFVPPGASAASSLELPAGRHAVFATYNDQPPSCTITDARGEAVPIRRPSVELTDNSDSIVTVLFGVFDLSAPGRVDVDCPRAQIGPPPQVRGPLGDVILWPIGLLLLIGAAPGLLLAGLAVARSRPFRTAVRGREGKAVPED